ncbi:hypothetical protein VNI00_012258 [Paramarasmius palmivorus]|uniref:Gustatory receptor n=1 Tax=Paramarasmius palmivorus TaxID=297713 RepID=A0AAW0C6H4_9AGAR
MAGAATNDIPQDLWLQRSRLNGMILAGFVYGIFFLLTIQAYIAVRRGRAKLGKWQAYLLYAYIIITFLLSTMCFACNARYTEDIWINFVGQRTPEDLILNEFDYWWNRMAVASTFVMIWIMDSAAIVSVFRHISLSTMGRRVDDHGLSRYHWCVIFQSHQNEVPLTLSPTIGLSIGVMHYAQISAVFFNIKVQIAFLVLSCTFNLIFTVLVSVRLLSLRKQIIQTLGEEHAKTYTSVTATLVESAALYFVFDVIFVFAFGFKSNVQNLILLEYSSIQGIAELLIIVRVARGQDYDSKVTTTKPSRIDFRRDVTTMDPGTLAFRPGTTNNDEEPARDKGISEEAKDIV